MQMTKEGHRVQDCKIYIQSARGHSKGIKLGCAPIYENTEGRAVGAHLVFLVVKIDRGLDTNGRINGCHQCGRHLLHHRQHSDSNSDADLRQNSQYIPERRWQ